jgi:hypothetical protein
MSTAQPAHQGPFARTIRADHPRRGVTSSSDGARALKLRLTEPSRLFNQAKLWRSPRLVSVPYPSHCEASTVAHHRCDQQIARLGAISSRRKTTIGRAETDARGGFNAPTCKHDSSRAAFIQESRHFGGCARAPAARGSIT